MFTKTFNSSPDQYFIFVMMIVKLIFDEKKEHNILKVPSLNHQIVHTFSAKGMHNWTNLCLTNLEMYSVTEMYRVSQMYSVIQMYSIIQMHS